MKISDSKKNGVVTTPISSYPTTPAIGPVDIDTQGTADFVIVDFMSFSLLIAVAIE